MNLKQLLKSKGISNDIIEAVERKTAKLTQEQEMKARMEAQKITMEIAREVFGTKQPPVPKKKTIIIDDK
jgi:SOS response regulatory protein OraA/RecX